MNVGILGVGAFLPSHVRSNDWWPDDIVRQWASKAAARAAGVDASLAEASTEGERRVRLAMSHEMSDPFRGSRERRIIDKADRPSDLETRAAKEAIERSGIPADEIDLVLGASWVPDVLGMPNTCVVHRNLGLRAGCMTVTVDAACNSFLSQLTLATEMIRGGRVRHALLVQSSAPTPLIPREEVFSPWFGDGATAVIIGPTEKGNVLSTSHETDGSYGRTLVCGIPGRNWYESGAAVFYVEDRQAAHRMLLGVADAAERVITSALERAHLGPQDVGFFAAHQPSSWFRSVIQEHCHLTGAKSVDTFAWAGSLTAANIPLVLYTAERERLLRDGMTIVMFSGGTGITYSSVVLRWGA